MMGWLLLFSGSAYAAGVSRLWRHAGHAGAGLSRWRAVSFAAALLTVGIALESPVDAWADLLFSAHMTQHELLMLIAAPLAALGRPGLAWLWLLPAPGRIRAGDMIRRLRPWWHRATHPAMVFALHAAVVWGAHLPWLFVAALQNEYVHGVQHFLLFASAALFWWALVEGRYGRLGYGAAVLFVFGTSLHTGLLGAGFTFAPRVVYQPYAERAVALRVDPLEDQQLAGLIMWIPAGAVFLLTGLGLFAAWLGASERRADLNGRGLGRMSLVVLSVGLSGLLLNATPAPTRVSITVAGTISSDQSRGINLSAQEATTVAALIGSEVVVDTKFPTVPAALAGVIAGRDARRAVLPKATPIIWLGSIPAPRTSCDFSIAHPSTPKGAVLWDATLVKFGAAQLNERFRRKFDGVMTPDAWTGWFAVKALTETLLPAPADRCRDITARRFDGHKGTALRFDRATGALLHPTYLVTHERGQRVVTEIR